MNTLSTDKQIAVISALTEGCSIRAVERLTGIFGEEEVRLGLRVGQLRVRRRVRRWGVPIISQP